MKFHVKSGDKVVVIAGNNKGKEGTIQKVLTKKSRAIVEGDDIRKVKKHTRPSAAYPEGGIIETSPSIHISNLMVINPTTGKPAKVAKKRNEKGKLERYFKEKKSEGGNK